MSHKSRREFIKSTTIGALSIAGSLSFGNSPVFSALPASANLYTISQNLLQTWADALLALQITDNNNLKIYGGIYCAADKAVHGRVADTIHPLFYLASKTKNTKYIDAAYLLYQWMENNVSQPDGSWLNEPVAGSWKGTTVFAAIALAETVKSHADFMDPKFKNAVVERLGKAGHFILANFTMDYGNINYPVTAAYGLSLLGDVLNNAAFKQRGKELAYESLQYLSPNDKLLFGEGDVVGLSNKACYAVDLGYNVEESLPALTLYGLLNKDEQILDAVTQSLKSHMEFMLPDGGWDNSWGTRNYKWTYWGSRTSDGCQSAYALMAHRDPRFYKVALQNTLLMQQCTVGGLLQGGPHYACRKVTPCVHHTFSHIKALATMLDHMGSEQNTYATRDILPRQQQYGVKFFADIQTWLVATASFKATITGYDREYKKTKNGHPTGGALSMLWHQKTGPLLSASMNEYQLYEAGNMQVDDDPHSMPLTPRIELRTGGKLYMNISDLNAKVTVESRNGNIIAKTFSRLVDKNQLDPAEGAVQCSIEYEFSGTKTLLRFQYDESPLSANVKIIVPVISTSAEKVTAVNERELLIHKQSATVKVTSNHPIVLLPTTNGRVFNYVPGFEALPLSINHHKAEIAIQVL